MARDLGAEIDALKKELAAVKQFDPRSPLARMLSDTSAKQSKTDQQVQRILSEPQQASSQAATVSGFRYIDPHQEVFTDTGSGANSLGAAQTVDFGPYVPSSARLAFCVLNMESDRSGGSAGDSNLYAEWLPDGGTDWLMLGENFDYHELVDNATVDWSAHCMVPLGASRSGQIRVFEALETWTYTLTIFGYE